MTDTNRLIELALKGLEAERDRINQEMADLQRRRSGAGSQRAGSGKAAGPSKKPAGNNLTPAGRKKLSDMMKKRWAERRRAAAKK